MSWGAQNRSKDAKTPSAGLAMSKKTEPGLWPVQPYMKWCPLSPSAEVLVPTTCRGAAGGRAEHPGRGLHGGQLRHPGLLGLALRRSHEASGLIFMAG
jgi:hypothetical protein